MKEHKTFNAFDKVIYRLTYSTPTAWHCGIFSDYNKQNNHITLCSGFAFLLDKYEILPYEGNEHLVGTTDEPEEVIELEKGEWVMCSMNWHELIRGYCHSRKFVRTSTSQLICSEDTEDGKVEHICNYAIRFSDFNPNDMEETKKHILCAKNGKIVKYHG